MSHPDMWPGIIVRDLATLEAKLGAESRDPLGRPDRYSYRELRRFADLIRDRLKQYPTIGKIDEIGTQNEAIYLYYSSRRFSGLTCRRRRSRPGWNGGTSTCPAAGGDAAAKRLRRSPAASSRASRNWARWSMDVASGYPTYLRDLVDIVRGYEDPPGVMNFRSVKVDAQDPPEPSCRAS